MGTLIEFSQHELTAYRADPPGEVRGAVVVVQEIWGLTDHIIDVTDRFAALGYIAIAPDLLGHIGLTPEVGRQLQELMFAGDEAQRSAAQPRLRDTMNAARAPEFAAWAVPALRSVVDLLVEQEGVDDDLAVVGFCFGGSYSFALALAEPRLKAAVVFYGGFPDTGDPADLSCPVLALYGSDDHGLTDALPQLEEGMTKAGADFTPHVYDGVGHAFFNDTNAQTHHPAVAADAWQRTIGFLEQQLAD